MMKVMVWHFVIDFYKVIIIMLIIMVASSVKFSLYNFTNM
jgi:hypothetical protein